MLPLKGMPHQILFGRLFWHDRIDLTKKEEPLMLIVLLIGSSDVTVDCI